MLICCEPPATFWPGQGTEVHPIPGADHCSGPLPDLRSVHPAQQDRHGEGTHLFLRDGAIGVGVDQPVDLFLVQGAAITFGADEVDDVM